MNPFLAIARGIRAASSTGSLVGLGWIYGLLAVLAATLTLVVYLIVSTGLANSTVAGTLRAGPSADWLTDTFSQPGAGSKTLLVFLLAVTLGLVYAVATVLLSGGVVSRVVGALTGGNSPREAFLAACGRFAGPMFRVALIEIVFLGFFCGVLILIWGVGLAGDAGNAFAWISVGAIALVAALVTAVADVARVHVVATGDRSAVAAWRDALSHSARRAPIFVLLVILNLAIAVLVAWMAWTIHGIIPRETGLGVIAALAVGQLGIVGRIWVRIVALATQASFRQLVR